MRCVGRGYGLDLGGAGGVGEGAAGVGVDGGEGGVREEMCEDGGALGLLVRLDNGKVVVRATWPVEPTSVAVAMMVDMELKSRRG